MTTHRRTILSLLAAVLVLTAGCTRSAGGTDDSGVSGTGSSDRPTPVRVILDKKGYRSDSGKAPPGWLRIEFRNETAAAADLSLVRLEGTRTVEDLGRDVGDPRALEALGDSYYFHGGLTMVGPGQAATFRTEVFPGRFVLGSVAGLAEGAGAVASLEIGAGDPVLDDPPTDSRVTFETFSFGVDRAFSKGGKKSVTAFGEGATHELRMYRVQPGVSGPAAFNTVLAMKDAPALATEELLPMFGIAPLNAGFINTHELALSPGEYVLTCFLIDAETSKSYAELGMRQLITVTG